MCCVRSWATTRCRRPRSTACSWRCFTAPSKGPASAAWRELFAAETLPADQVRLYLDRWASGSTGAADRERLRMARELVREVRVLDRNLVENGRRLEAALRVQGSALTLRREPATCFRR